MSLKTNKDQDEDPQSTHPGEKPQFIVGIGASAGGLDALEKFFRHMPPTSGVAFVIVQHLSPDFKSLMNELLSRYTTMAIHRVTNGIEVAADAIYLIPPRQDMELKDGRLYLTEFENSDTLHLSIDNFFRSLAHEAGDKAIAVVLSGTGSDGSRSLHDVAQNNGLIIVQDPASAGFDGMPRNAIATGRAKIICQPAEMPVHILRHINQETAVPVPPPEPTDLEGQDEISHIFSVLHRRFHIDFTQYKLPTIMRRIDRRMMMVRVNNTQAYLTRLAEDQVELDNLYRDLLIEVTVFFRDEPAFDKLKKEIIPTIVDLLEQDDVIRVWVPGCATGEEAYSIAILLSEEIDKAGKFNEIKVFATDVHQSSLDTASAGIYSENAVKPIPEPLLEKYFQNTADGYRIRKRLRQTVIFANHNLIQDPPFTKLDLISCRNVLIYLQLEAQQKVLSRFHFGLKTDRYLFLGPSEHIGDINEEFEVIDRRWRLFRKRRDGRFQDDTVTLYRSPVQISRYVERQQRFYRPRHTVAYDWYEPILEQYVPDGFLVNESLELVHTFGNGRNYLTQPTGQASLYVLRHLEGDLLTAVRTSLHRVTKEEEPISYTGIRVNLDGKEHYLQVTVSTISGQKQDSVYYLVTLQPLKEPPPPPTESAETFDRQEASSERLISVERELQYTKEYLQTTIEELETANEEMQSANEELLASNQELQSTNEELHAVNEELYTVNAEHQNKIEELIQLNNDVLNLQRNSKISVIFLDQTLKIRQFTPAAVDDFNLMPQDVGRPVSHLLYNINISNDRLEAATQAAMRSKKISSQEIATPNGQRFMMHIRPYLTEDEVVEGVVLTFHDITALKKAEFRLHYKILMEEHISDAIIITDHHFVIQEWGGAAKYIYGWETEEAIGQPLNSLLQTIYLDESVEQMQRSLNEQNHWQGNVIHRRKNGEELFINTTHSIIFDKSNKPISIVSVNRNNTEQKQAQRALNLNEKLLALAADISGLGIFNYSLPAKPTDSFSQHWAEITGFSLANLRQPDKRIDWFISRIHADDLPIYQQTYNALLDGRTDQYKLEYRLKNKQSQWIYILENATVTSRDGNGRAKQVMGVIQDITQHRERENAIKLLNNQLEEQVNQRTHELNETSRALEAEVEERSHLQEALRAHEEKYSHVVELSSEGIWIIDAESKTTYVNHRMAEMLGYRVQDLDQNLFFDFLAEADQQKANKIFDSLQFDIAQELDFAFRHKDGSTVWTIMGVKSLTNQDGSYNGVIATITDITRWYTDEERIQTLNRELQEKNQILRKLVDEQTLALDHTNQNLLQEIEERVQYESTLKNTEAKFEALLSQAPTAIIITTAQGDIQICNAQAYATLGYEAGELENKSVFQIIPEDQHSKLNKHRRKLLGASPNQTVRLDITFVRRNNTQFPGQVNMSIIEVENGRLIAHYINDITQRKQVENTLTAQAMQLQKSNEELQDFAYIVSHDLRAPLRALNTYSRFLDEDFGDKLGEDGHDYISGISESAKHMDSLITGLLAYARIDRPSQDPTLINSQEMLVKLVQNLNLNEYALINLPKNAPIVWGYEYQLQQIFANLFENSTKFIAEDVHPEIDVSFTQDDDFVTFAVKDNGIGISDKYFEKIFGIFQRLHTIDEYDGTGVGLAIIKKAIEKIGGNIWVSSALGEGSTFFFTMPKYEQAAR